MKLDKLGWVVAAALAGIMLGSGFQNSGPKFASVDLVKVFNDCDLGKKNEDTFKNAQTVRQNVVQFLQQNRAMLPADAEKYATLAIKANPTAADKQEMDRITKAANDASSKQRDLAIKPSPTEDEKKQLDEFSQRAQQNIRFQANLTQTYQSEIQSMLQDLQRDGIDKVRQAAREVGAKQGYSVVFSEEAAPYAPNDITADTLKAINKSK